MTLKQVLEIRGLWCVPITERRGVHYVQPTHGSRGDKCHCGVTRALAPAAKAKHQPAITAAAAWQPDAGMRTAALSVSARVSVTGGQ